MHLPVELWRRFDRLVPSVAPRTDDHDAATGDGGDSRYGVNASSCMDARVPPCRRIPPQARMFSRKSMYTHRILWDFPTSGAGAGQPIYTTPASGTFRRQRSFCSCTSYIGSRAVLAASVVRSVRHCPHHTIVVIEDCFLMPLNLSAQ
jgi:hypothetical protein